MLHEFAVDPSCLTTIEVLRRFVDQCAIHMGRIISDFPRNQWVLLVRKSIQTSGFLEQQQLTELLTLLQRRGGLIDIGRAFNAKSPWLDNAVREHARQPFHAIISEWPSATEDWHLELARLGPETPRWNVESERCVERTASSLITCMLPLVHRSREILFVDPHFTPDRSRYQNALRSYLDAAHDGNRDYRRIEVHAKLSVHDHATADQRRSWLDQFVADCNRCLPRQFRRGIRIAIYVWEEQPGSEKMHARYVLTECGGIRIDAGLDLGEPGQTTDVSLLPPSVRLSRWKSFQQGTSPFLLATRIEIIGTRK